MSRVIELILPSTKNILGYAEKLAVGIEAKDFARFPKGISGPIKINHPAFNYAHLALYSPRTSKFLGISGVPEVPTEYPELFAIGKECKDDVEGTIYPSMSSILETFFSGYKCLVEKLPEVSDEVFFTTNTEERTKDRFPLVGAFATYLLTAHLNVHLGQISSWRRCMGMPSV